MKNFIIKLNNNDYLKALERMPSITIKNLKNRTNEIFERDRIKGILGEIAVEKFLDFNNKYYSNIQRSLIPYSTFNSDLGDFFSTTNGKSFDVKTVSSGSNRNYIFINKDSHEFRNIDCYIPVVLYFEDEKDLSTVTMAEIKGYIKSKDLIPAKHKENLLMGEFSKAIPVNKLLLQFKDKKWESILSKRVNLNLKSRSDYFSNINPKQTIIINQIHYKNKLDTGDFNKEIQELLSDEDYNNYLETIGNFRVEETNIPLYKEIISEYDGIVIYSIFSNLGETTDFQVLYNKLIRALFLDELKGYYYKKDVIITLPKADPNKLSIVKIFNYLQYLPNNIKILVD